MSEDFLLELRSNVQIFIRIFGMLDQSVTPCGYPLSISQVYALQELEDTMLSVTELAQKLNLERSSVSRLVDGLVKEGLVSRDINEVNRREMILTLTEKGSRTIGQIRNQSLDFYRTVLESLPDSDQAIIMEGFKKFNYALFQYRGKQND